MEVALDEHNNRIYPDSENIPEKLFCQMCGKPVFHKGHKNGVRKEHFAHFSKEACPYSNDKDCNHEWHLRMQHYFPREYREYRFIDSKTGEHHIADIFIPESNIVLEFQHSPISEEEFFSRTNFHIQEGRKIVWLFDESEKNPKPDHFGKFVRAKLNNPPNDFQITDGFINHERWELPYKYELDLSNPYSNLHYKWLIPRESVANRGTSLWYLQKSNLSICVYTGTEGDIFHRVEFQAPEIGNTTVTFSLHNIAMKEEMDCTEFFVPEIEYQKQNSWLINYQNLLSQQIQQELNRVRQPPVKIPMFRKRRF